MHLYLQKFNTTSILTMIKTACGSRPFSKEVRSEKKKLLDV